MEFFATTVRGLEDVAAAEAGEILGRQVLPDVGKVIFEARPAEAALLNYASRSIHRVFAELVRGNACSLDEIAALCRDVDYMQFMSPHQSFAVRAERYGEHDFTSLEIAARVGHEVIESCKIRHAHRPKVDLNNPDVEFYALLRGDEFFLGINTTGTSLHRRFYRIQHHRAALLPTIAYCMLRMNGWSPERALLDPFCGGATIPIEAGLLARRICPGLKRGQLAMHRLIFFDTSELKELEEKLMEWELESVDAEILGSDASQKAIEMALLNVETAGLSGLVRLIQGDVRYAYKWLDLRPESIIMNPPFGVRIGLSKPERFYSEVFRSLAEIAPNCRLTTLATKLSIVKGALESAGWVVEHQRQITYGTLTAHILVAAR